MINAKSVSVLYVSQERGNDGNDGFSPIENGGSGPFATVEAALSAVRALRADGYLQPISIRILDRVYSVSRPIVIDGSVSDVTLEPMTETELCGGALLRGFRWDEYNGVKCLSADLSGLADLDFSDFYINGRPASKTRYPREGTLTPADVEEHGTELFMGSKWFIAKREDFEVIRGFSGIEDAYVSYYHYWIDEHSPIEALDPESGRITMRYVSRFSISPDYHAAVMEYVIENVGEMLREKGQWYCDKQAKRLYYIPEDDSVSPDETVGYLPVTDRLVVLRGTPDRKVRGIRIRGFSMRYTKGEYRSTFDAPCYQNPRKSDGFASDIQSVCDGHGSIELSYAHGCSLERCALACLGVHAVKIGNGCSRITLRGNRIEQIGGGGVYINGTEAGSPDVEQTHGVCVSHNSITDCGRRYYASCGVLIRHAYECTVMHNEIARLYYTGVSCGWVWGYGESICRDNLIEKNHIHHLGGGILSDMGGIYTLGAQPGTVVRGNLIHDVTSRHYGGWALYTDEGSRYITLEENVCYRTSSNIYHQHYGTMNTVRNNILALSRDAIVAHSVREDRIGILCERNLIVTDGVPPFSITRVGEGERDREVSVIRSCRNFICDIGDKPTDVFLRTPDGAYTAEQAREVLGMEDGSEYLTLEMRDPRNGDFTLPEDSPLYAMGFRPIDISDVGPAVQYR